VELEEAVKKVLMENPSILVEVLVSKPEILYQALAKIAPWQLLATKEDIRRLEEKMATKDDIRALEVKMATKEDLERFATKEDVKALETATSEEIRRLEERMATKEDVKRLEEVMATKEDVRVLEERMVAEVKRLEESMATKEDVKMLTADMKRLEEVMATKGDVKALEERVATKEEVKRLEERMATKEDMKKLEERVAALEYRFDSEIRRLEATITALGARWGVLSEEAFREGVRRLLAEAGWAVEKVLLFDREGYVYGEPSEVEYDVVVRDGKTFLVEITSALKRGDLPTLRRKREYFEKAKGVKVDAVFVVTPFIHDKVPERVKAMAKDMGIEVVYPTPP